MKTLNIYKPYKLQFFIVMIMAIILGGCEQFNLEENPGRVQIQVDDPFINLTQLELAVTGAYGRYWNANRQTTYHAASYAGDDLTTHRASNKADFREYDQRNVTNVNSRLTNNWQRCYEAIRAINNVIVNVEGVELEEKAKQDVLTGEMHFLRGVLFLHLTRIHGTIPLVLGFDPDQEVVLSTQIEVYNQIESDFLMAESLLPDTTTPGITRPSTVSARALLARLYLDWAGFQGGYDNSKYALAASSAKQVIDNSAANGVSLVEDMASLYTLEGAVNTESLFTIAFCTSCGRTNTKYGRLGMPGDFNGWQETFAEIRFFEDFPEGPRKEATYHRGVPVDADGNAVSDVAGAASFVAWEEFTDQNNPIFRKVVGPFEDNIFGGFRSDRGDYLMRYAEILLIYAEASGRSGNVTAEAWEALNQVRRRAAGLPVATPDANVDLVSGDIAELAYDEKKWELAGEYLRWYDLIRLERVDQALGGTARNPQVSMAINSAGDATPILTASNPTLGSTGTDNYFSQLPEEEISRLPGLQRSSPFDPK